MLLGYEYDADEDLPCPPTTVSISTTGTQGVGWTTCPSSTGRGEDRSAVAKLVEEEFRIAK